MRILLTGGLGFIGSHVAVTLGQSDENDIVIVDNLMNSTMDVLHHIKSLVKFPENVHFMEGDVLQESDLEKVFITYPNIDSVIHFASLKAVGESVEKPLLYYRSNLTGILNVLTTMKQFNCNRFVFSSSATVYGNDAPSPLFETDRVGTSITNPYGQTKYFQEQILMDYSKTEPEMDITILRYFNPVGAHSSGLIGENPTGIPNNLFPYILRVASGQYADIRIFGDDYDTNDGTGVRDFIHVADLAEGHVAALNHMTHGISIYNLGSGKGSSVMELIKTFERVNGVEIPFVIADRREGDVATTFADSTKAFDILGWKTTRTMEDICRDGYNFVMK
jgi:UDP-glucose 4-epimerase